MAAPFRLRGHRGKSWLKYFGLDGAGDLAADLELEAQPSSRLPPLPAVVAVFPDHALNDRLTKGNAEAAQLASDWSVQTLRCAGPAGWLYGHSVLITVKGVYLVLAVPDADASLHRRTAVLALPPLQ